MRQQIGLLRADFWDEYASSQRNPRNPRCYRYVGLTNSRHCRLVRHVSPLGTRGSFKVGPPEIYFKALVANRRHAGRVYRMGLDRLWGKRHLRIVEVAAHLSRQSPIETLGRGGVGDLHVVRSYLRPGECPHWGHSPTYSWLTVAD